MTAAKSLKIWKWIFLSLEIYLVTVCFALLVARKVFNINPDLGGSIVSVVMGIFYLIGWLFLLIVSPFFLRSLRGVALAGWIIAFGFPLMGMLFSVR